MSRLHFIDFLLIVSDQPGEVLRQAAGENRIQMKL
jgi:hypothetical protein